MTGFILKCFMSVYGEHVVSSHSLLRICTGLQPLNVYSVRQKKADNLNNFTFSQSNVQVVTRREETRVTGELGDGHKS